jgi:glycosyltransferase involved in cell wall biosynthesis
MNIGYFVPEFPNQTHAFFWREALALEESGMPVTFFSTRKPPADACPHDFAEAARARTHCIYPPKAGPAAAFLAARPLKTAALVTTVTSPLTEQVRGVIPGRDVPVIWMGVEMDRFIPPDRARPATGALHAVTVARLNRVKGHRYFLEAMARARAEGLDIRYSIAGDGPYREVIEQEIAEFGLTGHAELIGSLSQTKVLDLLQQADLLALTSIGRGEAAPVAVMEAMACGLPVICSRIGGTADMMTDGENGFLTDQKNVDQILTALRRLATEPGLADRISAAARAHALEAFDHRAKGRELGDAIRAALGAP